MKKEMKIHELIREISSKEDLADFVEALCDDLKENPDRWENAKLESFLMAMGRWIRVMDNYYKNTGQPIPNAPSWRTVADMLYAAKMYE